MKKVTKRRRNSSINYSDAGKVLNKEISEKIEKKLSTLQSDLKRDSGYYHSNEYSIRIIKHIQKIFKDEDVSNRMKHSIIGDLNSLFTDITDSWVYGEMI